MFKSRDTKFVMLFFAVICSILVYLMVNNFHIIDCCYFILVVVFAAKYLILSKN